MCHGDVKFGRRQSPCKCRICVTVDEAQVRFFFQKNIFDSVKHLARLYAVRSTANSEVVVRSRNIELFEEDLGHIFIIVLASVDYHFSHCAISVFPIVLSNRSAHRSSFYNLRPSSDNTNQFHVLLSISTKAPVPPSYTTVLNADTCQEFLCDTRQGQSRQVLEVRECARTIAYDFKIVSH